MHEVKAALIRAQFLMNPGFYAVVDGQYGSTGKGLLSSVLAEHAGGEVDIVTSNAGPNSGHTSYFHDEKVVLRQLPTFSVMAQLFHGEMPWTHLNAGAIIEPACLKAEIDAYVRQWTKLSVSSNAAVVTDDTKNSEAAMVGAIGSTGKGTGAALAAKVMRQSGAVFGGITTGLVQELSREFGAADLNMGLNAEMTLGKTVLAEVSQGFSLGLNAGGFYPYCTSRDCTVAQAMSDANVHPSFYRDCAMVVRTYPIRVAGNSGPCYADQRELSWDQVGQTPELTTVTQKIRRIFTWSKGQFMDAVAANRPGVIMVNFMNYLQHVDQEAWLTRNVYEPYHAVMQRSPKMVLLGYGPKNEDVRVHR